MRINFNVSSKYFWYLTNYNGIWEVNYNMFIYHFKHKMNLKKIQYILYVDNNKKSKI